MTSSDNSSAFSSWAFVASLTAFFVLALFAVMTTDTTQALYVVGALLSLLFGLRGAGWRPHVSALERALEEHAKTDAGEHEKLTAELGQLTSRANLLESDVHSLRTALTQLRTDGARPHEVTPQWGPAVAFLLAAVVLSVGLIVLVAWPRSNVLVPAVSANGGGALKPQAGAMVPLEPHARLDSQHIPSDVGIDSAAAESSRALWKIDGMDTYIPAPPTH